MVEGNQTVQLPLMACLLLDMPENGIDCSLSDNANCIKCTFRGAFAFGEGMDEYFGWSHVVCFIMGVLVVLIGSFGTVANILIFLVLQRQKKHRGFDAMLIGLAGFDLICSVTSVIAAISNVSYYQNFGRGVVGLYFYWLATFTAIFARSGSSFQTVLITLERYLCVAFPLSASNWFTVKNSQMMSVGIFIFSLFLAIPRFSSNYISENVIGRDVKSTMHLDYLIRSTDLEAFWYGTMGRFFDHIDFFVPLPALLILNGLIYVHILRFVARRKDLNLKQKKDIRAIRMFLPVVIVLFLCNIFPIVDQFSLHFYKVLHHEVYMGLLLSYVINSAANLPIYYYRGSSFQRETRALLLSACPSLGKYFDKRNERVSATSMQSDENTVAVEKRMTRNTFLE